MERPIPPWLRLLIGTPIVGGLIVWLWWIVVKAIRSGIARHTDSESTVGRDRRPYFFWFVVATQALIAMACTLAVAREILLTFNSE